MTSGIPSDAIHRGRPPALALPRVSPMELATQWAHYQVGPLTPAPITSPNTVDVLQIDPLSTLRPPARASRPMPLARPPSQTRAENARLLNEVAAALTAEQADGNDTQIFDGLCDLTGVCTQSLRRFEAMRRLMREEQALAQEGDNTSWRPGAYFLLALTGRVLIGMGATLLERLILVGQPSEPGTVELGPPQPHYYDYTKRFSKVKVMGGAVMLGVGMLCALSAAYLFWRQATQRNPKRAAVLSTLHIFSLALVVVHSFLFEWVLYNRPPRELLYASVPGILSAGLYAYTVPNSLTAAEVQLGLTPVGSMERRTELALVLGALGVAMFALLAGLAPQKGVQSYEKQGVLIGATVFLTTGTALAFTNARCYQSRLNRGKALRERARQASLTHSEESVHPPQPRRPSAIPAHLGRELLSVRPSLPTRSHPFGESRQHMLATPPSADGGSTPIAEASTPAAISQECIPLSALSEARGEDYFNLPFHSPYKGQPQEP